MLKFIQSIMMGFNPMLDEGGDESVVKFGAITVDTSGMNEAQIEAITKVQESYKNSSSEAIKLAQEIKTLKESNPGKDDPETKTKTGDEKSVEAMVQKLLDEKLKNLNVAEQNIMKTNAQYQINSAKETLKNEYSFVGDSINDVFKKADEFISSLPANQQTSDLYSNFVKANLADTVKQNYSSMTKEQAIKAISSDPAAMQQMLDSYMKDNNLDINMPSVEGLESEEKFQTRLQELKKEFNKPNTSSMDRAKIGGQINSLVQNAQKFGFKIN